MPLFRAGPDQAPSWCLLEAFEIIELAAGQSIERLVTHQNEHIICCDGSVSVVGDKVQAALPAQGQLTLRQPQTMRYAAGGACRFVCLDGRWETITSSGIFTCRNGQRCGHDTPADYQKTTSFDNHYHDCDEFWIILDGCCTVMSEGKQYEVGPGDCVATGRGWHHDVIACADEAGIRAVWFETDLEGQARRGHLWEPRHGPAQPVLERV